LNRKMLLLTSLALLSFLVRSVIAQDIASDFSLTDIDGVEFSLSDYRGKVVMLDFFATNCLPCVAEIPHLKVVHEEFGQDLVTISISVRPSLDSIEKLQQFRQEHEIDWIVARDTAGLLKIYVFAIPTIVIIDQLGYIRYVHSGGLTAASTLSQEIGYVISPVLIGDINGDGTVNILDISLVARAFGSEPGHPNWNAAADLNNDEVISIVDIYMVAKEYGKKETFNFLLNPSVEIDENGDNLPEYWEKGDYSDVGAVHTWLNTGNTGNRSVKVSITYNTSALGWHSTDWHQSFRIEYSPFEIGSTYLFRFWYKSSIKCYIWVSFFDGSGKWIESQSAYCEPTTIWNLSQWLEFTIPEGTYRMTVGISIRNSDAEQETNGYAIIDDFELIHG